ncbi:MAG: FAD-binding protein [Verrucomicrobiales bacterium]|nr:FAD-binding protein [Verrucomicrobiales bacterium]
MEPKTILEVSECVRGSARVIAVGAGTKRVLSSVGCEGFERLEMGGVAGVVEYDPGEYTITVSGGTRVADVEQVLAENGQYLPFEPPLVAAGATIGGTVAAGLNGAGALRYGGVRDFIVGATVVDGSGAVLKTGGKVVKNAAGFDVPKFLVGSLGRFGVICEVTFKVFPRADVRRTFRVRVGGGVEAGKLMGEVAVAQVEADALGFDPSRGEVYVRFGGTERGVAARMEEATRRWGGELMGGEPADELWDGMREFGVLGRGAPIVKVPLSPGLVGEIEDRLDGEVKRRYALGGNVGYFSLAGRLAEVLEGMRLSGVVMMGAAEVLRLGVWEEPAIVGRLKHAFDPEGRFPSPV